MTTLEEQRPKNTGRATPKKDIMSTCTMCPRGTVKTITSICVSLQRYEIRDYGNKLPEEHNYRAAVK